MFKDFGGVWIAMLIYTILSLIAVSCGLKFDHFFEHLFIIGSTNILIAWIAIKLINKYRKSEKNVKYKNDIIVREVNHRIKNNISILTNIIDLKKFVYPDPTTHELLDDLRNKTILISKIHEKIYESENMQFINISSYIRGVISTTNSFYDNTIKVVYDIDDIDIRSKYAIDIALIVQEFFTNSMKYAYENINDKTFSITLKRIVDFNYNITIKDNGVGFNPNLSSASNFGLKMVETIIKQYSGKIEYKSENGAVINITLKLN